MPRPLWNGSISFGLVTIPVKMYNAVSRKSVSFNQIDTRSGSRIKMKKVSAHDGSDVPDEAIVKGYELTSGNYVLLTQDELDAFEARASKAIEIDEFVDLDEIDPIFYDSAYYLAPDKATVKPYALLMRAMEASNKVGIARFVMRSKQYVAAIRPHDGHLVLSTMVYADEIVDPVSISEIEEAGEVEVSERELSMAQQLIDSLAAAFDPVAVQGRIPGAGARTDRAQGFGRRGDRGTGSRGIDAEGRRPPRRARSERARGQGRAVAPSGGVQRRRRRCRARSGEGREVCQEGDEDHEGRGEAGREGPGRPQAQVRLTSRATWLAPVSRSRSRGDA